MDKKLIASIVAANLQALKSVWESGDNELWEMTIDTIIETTDEVFCRELIDAISDQLDD